MNYLEHISINSNIRFGKPYIKQNRITVGDVLSWLASKMTVEEIISDFLQLTEIKSRACLAYEAKRDHKLNLE